jgi:hypothetical protein
MRWLNVGVGEGPTRPLLASGSVIDPSLSPPTKWHWSNLGWGFVFLIKYRTDWGFLLKVT